MAIVSLIDLDFAPGIKSKYINENFQIIHDWLTKERLRIGGWGLVEGFDITVNSDDFTVGITEGIMINQEGEEVIVDPQQFFLGELEYTNVTNKEYIVNAEGMITLDNFPYDHTKERYITYNPPEVPTLPDESVFKIVDSLGYYVPIVKIIGQNVWVNQTEYRNKKLKVSYEVALDRIDSIMLHKDGTYEYERSIDSTSPSHVDLADYEETFCVGVIYWGVSEDGVQAEVFTNHRSYRPVYVNMKNELYLNGELYKKPKWIYFEEPDEAEREINDLWYDQITNSLYIWRYRDGELGWVLVNDRSEIVIQERKCWTPGQLQTMIDSAEGWDYKTFKFDVTETNMFFVPGQNSLSITIDNTHIMDDQYLEITMTDAVREAVRKKIEGRYKDVEGTQEYRDVMRRDLYVSTGMGFKLKEPLTRTCYVEVTVTHVVRMKPVKETFQRASIFVAENVIGYDVTTRPVTDPVFQCLDGNDKVAYAAGEEQLEIFLNGIRLSQDNGEWSEIVDLTPYDQQKLETDQEYVAYSNSYKDYSTTRFSISRSLLEPNSNYIITWKITKQVWSYDQLDNLIKDIRKYALEAYNRANTALEKIEELSDIVNKRLEEFNRNYVELDRRLQIIETNYLRKDDMVDISQIPSGILNRLFASVINVSIPTTNATLKITGCRLGDPENNIPEDFIQVFYVSDTDNFLMIRDLDYTLEQVDDDVHIYMNADYRSSNAHVQVTGFRLGIGRG